MEALFKAYVYKNMFTDLAKFLKRTAKSVDFDADSWLQRVGLTTYHPVRRSVGGASLLLVGVAAGVVVGLVLAPKPGAQLREDVKEKARDVLDSVGKLTGGAEAPSTQAPRRARA